MGKVLSQKQKDLALVLKQRHELHIPDDVLWNDDFCRKFIDLFAYDHDAGVCTGLKRVQTIIDYLYYDKDQRHLQFKLELNQNDVTFMVEVLSKYKFDGDIPREDLTDPDPEFTAYQKAEQKIYDSYS